MSHPAFDTVANVAREIFVEHEAKGRSMKSPRIFPREAGAEEDPGRPLDPCVPPLKHNDRDDR